MSELRDKIEDHVTVAACTGWCDSRMRPNDLVIKESTDAIMSLIESEGAEQALREALELIDAHDPETRVNECSEHALRGLVNRMGQIARDALAGIK